MIINNGIKQSDLIIDKGSNYFAQIALLTALACGHYSLAEVSQYSELSVRQLAKIYAKNDLIRRPYDYDKIDLDKIDKAPYYQKGHIGTHHDLIVGLDKLTSYDPEVEIEMWKAMDAGIINDEFEPRVDQFGAVDDRAKEYWKPNKLYLSNKINQQNEEEHEEIKKTNNDFNVLDFLREVHKKEVSENNETE